MKKGIIFDLDGTLWDASEPIAESWNVYLEQEDPTIEVHITGEDIRGVCGKTMDEFADILMSGVDTSVRYRLAEGCCAFEVDYLKGRGGMLYPKLLETLRALAERYHLYIVSNCQIGYIRDFLEWSGTIDLFEDTEDFGSTGMGKADNIRLLYKRNRLDEAIYVGDTVMDWRSAKEAGLPFVFASYGYGQVEAPDAVIDTFEELPGAAEKLLG